ncbi:hypothetical protein [Arthrobacter oryzae]|uniref:hypothetical protein n=1 Tax=Arthrobacter oryzae TaxID=409290 RepID=UPI00273AB0BD|nr:hypothetical protein [Arthrobacter oryzae]WLQ06105.1 hypothetical protein Q8Z05_18770 [Arthrobacter oryzae]
MKRKRGIILTSVLAGLAVIAIAGFFLVRAAEDRVTADFVNRVDRFSVPANWPLESGIVRREMFLCMDTNPCPSIYRRWNVGGEFTADDLKAVSNTAGVTMSVKGTCARPADAGGVTTACSASGNDGEYDYTLKVVSPGKNNPLTLVLTAEPHR